MADRAIHEAPNAGPPIGAGRRSDFLREAERVSGDSDAGADLGMGPSLDSHMGSTCADQASSAMRSDRAPPHRWLPSRARREFEKPLVSLLTSRVNPINLEPNRFQKLVFRVNLDCTFRKHLSTDTSGTPASRHSDSPETRFPTSWRNKGKCVSCLMSHK